MASGDTKTNQYLDIAANGTRADLPADTCCETRTQSLIRGVAERVMDVEDEVERLENNPDVVDIVATYQDLQDYDTSGLTDKDIIRVLEDSTHEGNSTYYRWNATTSQFDYIGEISGGGTSYTAGDGIDITNSVISATNTGKARVLTSADFNANSSDWTDTESTNFNCIAGWKLEDGLYAVEDATVRVYANTGTPISNTVNGHTGFIVSRMNTNASGAPIIGILSLDYTNSFTYYSTDLNGVRAVSTNKLLNASDLLTTTGASSVNAMSQNATTSMIYADPSTRRKVRIGDSASATGTYGIAIGTYARAESQNFIALGTSARKNGNVDCHGSVALGANAVVTGPGQVQIGTSDTFDGYNSSNYRLLTGLYDPQDAHDAANKEYVDGLISALEARIAALEGN